MLGSVLGSVLLSGIPPVLPTYQHSSSESDSCHPQTGHTALQGKLGRSPVLAKGDLVV